jgi:hypothetical protein
MRTSTIFPGTVLEEAEYQSRKGHYTEAIKILEGATVNSSIEHPRYWEGIVCVMSARNKLHVQDDLGALQFIKAVEDDLRAVNPKIDAECRTVLGILCRREGYRLWKSVNISSALVKANESIKEFELAETAAQMALEERLQHNARLNKLYSEGLILAIQKSPQNEYIPLVVESIIAEAKSRECMAPNTKDHLSGLTIVIDLALGGGVTPDQVFNLSENSRFHWAYRIVIGNGKQSWPEFIFDQYNASISIKSDVAARALLLGSKILLTEINPDHALLRGYASFLRICSIDLNSSGTNRKTRELIDATISKFPSEIIKMVTRHNFLG